ncbi:MAG TPA: hypothetical protein VI216_01465, partial [Candidatus Acidoferrales bacterium]
MGGTGARDQFSWRLLLAAAVIGLLIFAAIATCRADTSLFLNVFVFAPALLVVSIASVIYGARQRRQPRRILATLAVVWAMAGYVFLYNRAHPFEIPEAVRWFLWSSEFQKRVLAQPAAATGDLKHIEWDASGFAGVGNNTAYLVFD